MKASIFCILVLVTISKGSPEIEEEERMKAIYVKCRNETQLDEESTTGPPESNYKAMKVPMSQKAKCMMGCVMRETGMIVNRKFNKEGSLKLIDKFYLTKKDDAEKAKTVIDACDKQVANETDECNLASKIAECFNEEAKKAGLGAVPLG